MDEDTLLITGASGFLGRALLDTLSDVQAERTVAVSRRGYPLDDRCSWVAADLTDPTQVADLFRTVKPHRMIHLAWLSADSDDRYEDPLNRLWARASDTIMAAFVTNGGRRAIVAGSCIEYGPAGGIIDEAFPPAPDTLYGQCKLRASNSALRIGLESETCSVAVGRVFFSFGPHEDHRRLIPSVALSLLSGSPAALSAGTQQRDFLPSGKVAEALLALLDIEDQGVFNIGSGSAISVKDLAIEVAKVVGRPDLLEFGARPPGGDHAEILTADISKLLQATDWKPDFVLSHEIKTLVDILAESDRSA